VKLLKELLAREGKDVIVTRGSTYENSSNLAPTFFDTIVSKYEGTRLGRQELLAEMLTDVPNALWQRSKIDELRVTKHPELIRIVVAIDPAAKSEEGSDETGIIVAGKDRAGHGYILNDLSGQYQPLAWAAKAIGAYKTHKADRIIAEINNGGEMVEATLRTVDKAVSYRAVHATRGKVIRAEPIAALYEQGKIHHVGSFPKLEDQLCEMTLDFDRAAAGYSPDRLDAAVWALTELMPETRSFFG
jgi:phage terminase large subunit-like protein